jgi:polysaccharide deacetylase family protein (PEP-CTERM system associated)
MLEDIGGVAVQGLPRAQLFHRHGQPVGASTACCAETGHRYSSSIYPIQHDHYGMPDAPRFAYRVRAGLLEVPVTTLRLGNRNLPSSGGGYFRLLPYALSRWMLQRVNQQDGEPAIFYFHPWEIDPGQPRIPASTQDALPPLREHRRMEPLARLLRDFRWGRMDDIFLTDPGADSPPA